MIRSLDTEAREAANDSSTALSNSKEADKKSGEALEKAGKAENSLGKAETDAKNAQAASLSAVAVAKETRKEADSFERDIAAAKAKAAELDARTRSRHLTAEQEEAFVNALKVVLGESIELSVTITGGDEALTLRKQLLPLFKQASWTVADNFASHLDISISGIGIMAPKSLASPDGKHVMLTPALTALRSAFTAAGMDVQFLTPTRTDDVTEVIIGAKPNP